MPGLYIHIPFCRKKCNYCDFYSIAYKESLASDYIDVLCGQIKNLEGLSFSTIYIGGGTPSVLERMLLEKLLGSLERFIRCSQETTIEVNPESLDLDKINLFKERGINRISIGVQSFQGRILEGLSRIHTPEESRRAISLSLKKFDNVNIDLIFAVPGQSTEDWLKDLEEASKYKLTHISCYNLTYEEGTVIHRDLTLGRVKPVDNEEEAVMYQEAIKFLRDKGFVHYEISNFAKEGFFCRHNLGYWQGEEFLGLGPTAGSFWRGKRLKNVSSVEDYIIKVKEGFMIEEEKPSSERLLRELLVLGLRKTQGVDFGSLYEKTGRHPQELLRPSLEKLVKDNFIEYIKNNTEIAGARLTPKGILFFDDVASSLL